MAVARVQLPQLISLEDYNGNYQLFIDAVYAVFEKDFIKHKTAFGSHRLKMKYHPAFQERSYTFYHMTHEGDIESERTPDLRRCERMPWARPTIENVEAYGIRFWEQERNGKSRICIWLDTDDGDNYFVILDVRKTFVLLWTAFYAGHSHQLRKKEKEYQAWKESVGKCRVITPDGLVKDIMDRLP